VKLKERNSLSTKNLAKVLKVEDDDLQLGQGCDWQSEILILVGGFGGNKRQSVLQVFAVASQGFNFGS